MYKNGLILLENLSKLVVEKESGIMDWLAKGSKGASGSTGMGAGGAGGSSGYHMGGAGGMGGGGAMGGSGSAGVDTDSGLDILGNLKAGLSNIGYYSDKAIDRIARDDVMDPLTRASAKVSNTVSKAASDYADQFKGISADEYWKGAKDLSQKLGDRLVKDAAAAPPPTLGMPREIPKPQSIIGGGSKEFASASTPSPKFASTPKASPEPVAPDGAMPGLQTTKDITPDGMAPTLNTSQATAGDIANIDSARKAVDAAELSHMAKMSGAESAKASITVPVNTAGDVSAMAKGQTVSAVDAASDFLSSHGGTVGAIVGGTGLAALAGHLAKKHRGKSKVNPEEYHKKYGKCPKGFTRVGGRCKAS